MNKRGDFKEEHVHYYRKKKKKKALILTQLKAFSPPEPQGGV